MINTYAATFSKAWFGYGTRTFCFLWKSNELYKYRIQSLKLAENDERLFSLGT